MHKNKILAERLESLTTGPHLGYPCKSVVPLEKTPTDQAATTINPKDVTEQPPAEAFSVARCNIKPFSRQIQNPNIYRGRATSLGATIFTGVWINASRPGVLQHGDDDSLNN